MRATFLLTAMVLTGACGPADPEARSEASGSKVSGSEEPAAAAAPGDGGNGWNLRSSAEGVALVLGPGAEPAVRFFCPAGGNRLLVNVPSLQPVGSEERLSFGSGSQAAALVADTSGDRSRGGVSASGALPDDLAALLRGPVSVSYGAQKSGPHQAPPEQLARAFAAACSGEEATRPATVPQRREAAGEASGGDVGACMREDGRRLPPNRLKAIGTEPFWAAEIRGRCVTYSTPENQKGTRIWTSFDGSRDSGVWTGYYQDRKFVLRTRPAPGCSDGMSDKRYPVGVTLVVGGEERLGCAEYP